jgi:histone acetyltransferase (RNA polymerase elongator complex component)
MRHYNIPIFVTHLGCPNMCVFCNQSKITGREEEQCISEVTTVIDSYLKTIPPESAVEVAFFGGSFTGISFEKQMSYLKSVKKYIESGRVNGIRISTRPDYINEENIKYLKENGVTTIELGVQSFDEKVMKKSKRGYTPKVIYEACDIIKKSGISLGIQLMPGLPGASFESDYRSGIEAAKIKPDIARIYPTLVISGTELEEMYDNKEYIPLTIDEAVFISMKIIAELEISDVKIIRVGLQPSEDIRAEGVIKGGPFHSAFRELVEGEIIYRFILENSKFAEYIEVEINPKDISRTIGINKRNIMRLKSIDFKYKTSIDIAQGEIKLNGKLFKRKEILKKILR